jgi:enoyl-CoA hydratase
VTAPLQVRRDGPLATVTLDRPAKRNALSIELRLALASHLDALSIDDDVSTVLLTGAGSAFCAGMDVTEFGGDRAHKEQLVRSSGRAFGAVARFPKPIVAYLNGPAIAGGFALALLCDLRIAAPSARLGFPEIGRHIPPSYAAARAALPEALARELCLTGRVLEAPEALARGVVSSIGDRAHADAVVGSIAAAPADVTAEVKRRALLYGEESWQPMLADEMDQLREALLGESGVDRDPAQADA